MSVLTRGDSRLPPLIFLHGFLGSKEDWEEMIPFFSDRFHCMAIDLPGHGGAPLCGAILPTLRNEIPGMTSKPPVLIGYSMGGRIAMQLKSIAGALVNISGHPGLKTCEERAERLKADQVWANKLAHLPFKEFLSEWYAQPLFAPGKDMIRRRIQQDPKHLAEVLLQMSLAHQIPMDNFPCPTLFLHGEKDLKYREAFGRLGGVVTVRQIQGCGHALHLENPPLCAHTILNWMGSGSLFSC
jgi:2-succinyl-6-hydroxy-2,4-cyclohexadiene-1-carboxylate synthase